MNDNQNQSSLLTLLLCLGLFLVWNDPSILERFRPPQTSPTPIVKAKAIRATYVFEKSQGVPPGPVAAALRSIAESGVASSAVDQDVKNGDGDTPKQYEVAIREAKRSGVPCLVVEFDDGVAKCSNPTTEEDVRKAVLP